MIPKINIISLAALALTFMISTTASAGKIDEVKAAVKEKCQKELLSGELTAAVMAAYDCNPGADVNVAGCTIACKKPSGSVVGGK